MATASSTSNGDFTDHNASETERDKSGSRPSGAISVPAPSNATPSTKRAEDVQRPAVVPPIDIYDSGDGLVLVADLPGVSGQTVDVQVQDNKLTLFGRLVGAVPDDAVPLHREFIEADFLRSFILSDDVDHDRIEASMNGGVLTVCLPRVERSKPRKIDVKVD